MKTELTLHERSLSLHRFPKRTNETLQAWDAGDEYVINYVEEQGLDAGKRILILNDSFGALSCWFSQNHHVTMMSDSFISHRGTLKNLHNNGGNEIELLTTMDDIPQHIDLVLFQLPKSNRHLIWQLVQLRNQLPTGCPVIAVNKAKEIHTSTLKLFEKYLGETTTSLAWKKHRLVFSVPNCTPIQEVNSFVEWDVDGESIHLKNLPNVYSGESLDLGARFLLQHLPQDPNLRHVIDLGCGNGVLSVKMGQLNPQARITCVDESFMAVESARQNLMDNLGEDRNIQCITNNCLDGFKQDSAFLVLCNPPFHQQQTITDHIAWQMFCDAKHVLNKGGQLLVIGNRHLGYDVKLARLFGQDQVKTVATNNKFVILQATK
ncbi:methyltransferase [Vibrio aestuarianus]|uniref:methyltransferase n=1 Tax=Vibrio aestuarianus TaxID=28171 RepID=UPI00144848F0|nr:methyltransferase [Vibrio aestuarianus]MDE1212781.1 methyltransferase [Vibrio aestuarianus]MDE1216131.1 methyltransferase [Vibrio aestuarianus]MDE1221034.1 methyltransferase [Vibrio aestuarianus]MDE1223646.1 methyltransferase [Vibrio aestuarianus]MDE1259891.1 methyltransferase [Vibrio aestuarianus]